MSVEKLYPGLLDGLKEPIVQFSAAFSVPAADADRVDLLLGIDPRSKKLLDGRYDLDYILPYLYFVRPDEVEDMGGIKLWRSVFNAEDLRIWPYRNLLAHLCALALRNAKVHAVVYGFRHLGDVTDQEFDIKARSLSHDAAGEWGKRASDPGRALYSTDSLGHAPLREILERRGGMEADLRRRISLDSVEPGFLLRYLRTRGHEMSDLLTSRQFEELAMIVLREEGWHTTLTQPSRDGGKDIVATRIEDGVPVVTYIEAKKYAPKRPVRLGQVKEFVATLAGDGIERGVMMTTSYFTPDAKKWADTSGYRLAKVDFLDRARLVDKLASRFDQLPRAFRKECGSLLMHVPTHGPVIVSL